MLSINERIRWIFEQSDMEYGRPTENEEELVRRFQIAIQLRNQKVQQVLEEGEREAKVFICFVINCHVLTDSRCDSIRRVILTLSQKMNCSERKKIAVFAAVFYKEQGYQVIRFTSNSQSILDLVYSPRGTRMREYSSVSLLDELEAMNFAAGVCQELHESISSFKAVVHFTAKSPKSNPASKAIEDRASRVGDSFRQKNLSYYWVPISWDEKVLTVLQKHFVGMEAIELRSSDALVKKILQDANKQFRNVKVDICGIPNFTVATATPDSGAPDWKDAAAEDFQYHAIGVPASIQSIVDGSELNRTVFSVQVRKAARPFAFQGLVAEYFALLKEGEAPWHKATVREFLVCDCKNTFKQPFVLLNACEILQVATFLFQEFNRLNKIVPAVKPFPTAVIIPRTRRAGLAPALLCPFRFEKKLAGANQFEIIDDDWNPGKVTSAKPIKSDAILTHDSEPVRKNYNYGSDRRGAAGFAQSAAGNPSYDRGSSDSYYESDRRGAAGFAHSAAGNPSYDRGSSDSYYESDRRGAAGFAHSAAGNPSYDRGSSDSYYESDRRGAAGFAHSAAGNPSYDRGSSDSYYSSDRRGAAGFAHSAAGNPSYDRGSSDSYYSSDRRGAAGFAHSAAGNPSYDRGSSDSYYSSDRRGAAGFSHSAAGNPSSKQASPGYIVHRQTSQRSSVSSPKRFKLEDPSNSVLNCFAHWTHSVTGGYLMVENLEIYSESVPDEAGEALIKSAKIHCLDVTRFLPWNLGKPGIRRYFQKHKCNNWCKDMRLQRVLIEK
ncbi:hypothetical protein BOX15_Mlig014766g1 [Macrostomum lignano]|uniref:Alpha-type protein kinase domain-containing protein n=1 Tax=Macrostomum lignano TaxID=282301 RepID=A0A267EZ21_9PLAT|nr:hypothetical protein BOX15_Mlig014766g1 [Macrostomum lignano]